MKKICYLIVANMVFLGYTSCVKGENTRDESTISSQESVEPETVGMETVNPKTIALVKAELATWQQRLPIEGGVGMIITAMEYDDATNTIKYRYRYTIPEVTKPTDAQVNVVREAMIAAAKSSPKERQLLDKGISFHYDYYSVYNKYLFSMEITPEDMTGDAVSTDYEASSYYETDQPDIPDFSGDWESTNPKFRLSLSLSQHDGEVEVIVCQIYRTYAWEPTVRIEDGKLILDDPNDDFSFHAEFVLRDGKLTGQCRAKGCPSDPNFSGILTLIPEVYRP